MKRLTAVAVAAAAFAITAPTVEAGPPSDVGVNRKGGTELQPPRVGEPRCNTQSWTVTPLLIGCEEEQCRVAGTPPTHPHHDTLPLGHNR